jgi:LysM repeat protein
MRTNPVGLPASNDRPAAPQQVFAQAGDTLTQVAQRHGVDPTALRNANPDLPNPDFLLTGQALRLPLHDGTLTPATAGIGAAVGREGVVQGMMQRAYDAGLAAPQEPFDGTVLRSVSGSYESGALDHTFGNPGRYNSGSERLVYTAPDLESVFKEAGAYQQGDTPVLSSRSIVSLQYKAEPDATGRGGVADLAEGTRRTGLPTQTLTHPKGGASPSLLHQLTGEHPYTLPQQAGKGAADAGASGIKAPSAEAKAQINVIPRNTAPEQLRPLSVVRHDHTGVPSLAQPADHIRPLPANDLPAQIGPLNKAAGLRPTPPGDGRTAQHMGTMNQAPESAPQRGIKGALRDLNGAAEGYPRASSVRYGATGAVAATLVDAGVAMAKGQSVPAAQLGKDVATNGAVGASAAKAVDLLTPRMGLVRAGGAIGGAIQASVSGYQNYRAYQAGQVSGSRAIANTVVDTGTAVAAGAAGAAAGAAVGSIVPIAGTAAGAVVGFGVGVGVHYGIQALDHATGMLDGAKSKLADGFQATTSIASKAWSAVAAW